MGKVIPIVPGIEIRQPRESTRFWRRRRFWQRVGGPAMVLACVAGGTVTLADAMEAPGPIVQCAGDGQVSRGQGYINAVQKADNEYGIGLSGSEVFDLGTELSDTVHHELHRGALVNEWVWIGATANGQFVANLGQCPADLPGPKQQS